MSDSPSPPTLQGRRCVLRALQPGDAVSLQRHADDPAVAHNLFDGFPQPYTQADAQAWCGPLHREPRFGHVWGLEVAGPEGREVAGCISVAPQTGLWGSSAVIGYWLGRAHWRQGITSEALGLVTAWAWGGLPGIARLWMPIFARNAGSQAVARKAGYVLEGRLPLAMLKAGEAVDGVLYGSYRPGLHGVTGVLPPLHA